MILPNHHIIYMFTNNITNKSYIGLTRSSIGTRWIQHKSLARRKDQPCKFHLAINKYGYNCWDKQILCCTLNQEDAQYMEKTLIELMDTYKNGYNSTIGGEYVPLPLAKRHHTEETKQKLRDIHKGKRYHPPIRGKDHYCYGKIGHMVGKTHSDNTKQKMKDNWKIRKHQTTRPQFQKPISCIIDGKKYVSMAQAVRSTGYSYRKIYRILREQSRDLI